MTISIKPELREQKSVISELIGIENKTPKEAHKAISIVLYNQYKTIEKLRDNNRKLWLQIQQRKIMKEDVQENIDTTQVIMKRIWDNKEDEFWDTF